MNSVPRYSFVATSRNDDHGGDILRRTQSWVTRLAQQAERHEVPCELILVDWNPPTRRAPLSDVLAWPRGSEWFSARVLTVPRGLHHELRISDRLTMFQMIAKNVGIRRAASEHIIATNVDIIFSDELFRWLKTTTPGSGRLYRSDRWDVPNEVQFEPDLDVLLQRARQKTIRRNLRDGTYVNRDGQFINTTPTQFDSAFYDPLKYKLERLDQVLAQAESGVGPARSELKTLMSSIAGLRENFFLPVLHTNGCGDFTLLSRHDWFALRGYPEWHIFSWAIDSAIIFQAHYNGILVTELGPDLVHYHIEHDYGSGWTPEGSGSLWARLDQRGIPYITYEQFTGITKELQRNAHEGRFTVYNELNWGFFDREIEDRVLVENGTPARPPLRINEGPLEETLDLVLVADLPLEKAVCHGRPQVRFEPQQSADGVPEIAVETQPDQWSYSLAFDVPDLVDGISECWLSIELQVEYGVIYASLLNREQTDFLVQIPCTGPTVAFREVRSFVKDIGSASQLVFRNGTQGGEPARFRVRSVRILRESHTAQAADHDAVAVALLRGESLLSNLRPGSPDIIVRLLPESADAAARNQQAMIILPVSRGDGHGAVLLDMLAPSQRGARLSVKFHVIEGEVGIAVVSQPSGGIVAAHRERAGRPFTSLDLDLSTTGGTASLVIRNLSPSSRTKVLLHSLDYQTDACA